MDISQIIKQKSYERVVFQLHRHWVTFIPMIVLFFVLLFVPVILYLLISNLIPYLLENQSMFAITILSASIYYIWTYLFFYVHFIDYYLDTWIVTNDRIVDIEQNGLFNRETTEFDLYRIQDVTANITGIVATFFRYGDVIITTASSNANIVFKNISKPNHVREELIRLADEDRKYHYSIEQKIS